MYSRLHSFLSKHDCIYINQFGFRKNHSTIHALISLTEQTRDSLDQNKILLDKLAYYGIRGVAIDWFRSYLNNRQQYVSINGHDSSKVVMKYGQ